LGVERAEVEVVEAGSVEANGPPGLSIFLQVSSSTFKLETRRKSSKGAGLAAGRVKVTEG
jgi:hypothetical protein